MRWPAGNSTPAAGARTVRPFGHRDALQAVLVGVFQCIALPFIERTALRPARPGVEVVACARFMPTVARVCCCSGGFGRRGAVAAGTAVPLRAPVPGRLPIGAGPVGLRTRPAAVTNRVPSVQARRHDGSLQRAAGRIR